jgi:hypothetical protein
MTQLTEAIPPRLDGRGRTEDRRAQRVDTAWLIRGQTSAPLSSPVFCRDAHTEVPVSADGPTLVILSDAVPAVTESAVAALRAGGRLYVLAPADGASSALLDWVSNAPSTSVLIRRVREAPMAALLSGGQGWLWVGPSGPGEWRLTLDAEQIEMTRLAFLKLYWNHSDDEAWPDGDRVQWHARGDAPFDVPAVLPHATVRLEPGGARLPAPGPSGSVYSPDGQLPEGHAAHVWVPPSGERHADLAAALRRGSRVVWTDLSLPACTTGSHATVMPSTTRWSLRVALTSQQAIALTRVFAHEPNATFRTAVSLGEAQAQLGGVGQIWCAGQTHPEALIGEQNLNVGGVPASSLRDMPVTEPSSWPEPALLALSAHWSWQVIAPQVPKGAVEDPLPGLWRAVDNGYAARVESALATLAELEEKEGALARAFATPKGALLGFRRSRMELRENLLTCRGVTLSLVGPEGAREWLSQLAELEARVERLREDVAEAERKIREETERKRQEQEYAAAQKKAREELAVDTKKLTEAQQQLAEIETRLGKLASRNDDISKRDRKAAQGKLRHDQKRIENQIRRLEQLVGQARETIDKPFEYRRPAVPTSGKQSTGSFIPSPSKRIEERVPDEALPAVGRLLRAGKDRLLAISRWEELDRGEAEADRLSARLVAIVEDA